MLHNEMEQETCLQPGLETLVKQLSEKNKRYEELFKKYYGASQQNNTELAASLEPSLDELVEEIDALEQQLSNIDTIGETCGTQST